MSFIGKDGRAAPTLKQLIYNEELIDRIWEKTVKLMVKLYNECNLIHADLSEYNLMWHENNLWCIDVSQAVRTTHPMAYRFLWRDCTNICKVRSFTIDRRLTLSNSFAFDWYSFSQRNVARKSHRKTCFI